MSFSNGRQLFLEHRQRSFPQNNGTESITAGVTAGTNTALAHGVGWKDSSFMVKATLNSGAGDLTIIFQDSPDGSNWRDYVTFDTLSASGVSVKSSAVTLFKFERLRYVITGTANYTFTVYQAGFGV